MISFLFSRVGGWGICVLLLISLFVFWRSHVEKTEQIRELTKQKIELTGQLKLAYENPKIEYREKIRIVKGRERIKEKIVYIAGTETQRVEERDIEIDPTITETGVEGKNEPTLPRVDETEREKKYCVQVSYFLDKTITASIGKKIWFVDVGIVGKADKNFKDLSIGGFIGINF
ncbi:MAG: hypothetical protein AB1567_12385 [bacterium]